MSTLVLLGAAPFVLLSASSCYTDTINKAPKASITVDGMPQVLTISGPMPSLSARLSSDPDHDKLRYSWDLRCTDEPGCSFDPLPAEREMKLQLAKGAHAHAQVRATLTVTDPRGASSQDTMTFQATNQDPTITVAASSRNRKNRDSLYTVGRQLTVDATKEDVDQVDSLKVTWAIVKRPDGATPEVPTTTGDTYVIRPDKPGKWTVRAAVTDGFEGSGTADFDFEAEPDLPPCLESLDPEVPALSQAKVVVHRAGGPRTFTVGTVDDDLDTYPRAADPDDRSDVASFRWSVLPPGLSAPSPGAPVLLPQVVVGQIANAFSFDPSIYAPGDQVEVRVDVSDRVERGCPVDEPTCEAAQGCRSRYTWNVEVR